MSAKILILCGKIASGKTTYALNYKKEHPAIILSVDEVMLKLYDGCLKDAHNETASRILDYFLTLIPDCLNQNISCILDYGFWTKKERQTLIDKITQLHLPYEMIYVTCKDEERIKRLAKRNQLNLSKQGRQYIIQEDLLRKFDQKFEALDESENYVQIKTD